MELCSRLNRDLKRKGRERMGRRRIKNRIMLAIAALLLAFAVAAIPMDAHAEDSADHSWNVRSVQFIPASPAVDMSKIMERDNDGIYALNLANRYKSGFNNCFFMTGDKCVVTYDDNSTKVFTFSKIRGIGYAEFKSADGEVINLEALDTDNAKELKNSGEVSVDELAAIIGENGVNIEYGEYWEEGNEIVGHCVRTHAVITVTENKTHDHKTAIRTRNEAAASCISTGMSRECQYCQICGKYFADTEATIELNKADLIIPIDPNAHRWGEWTVTKNASLAGDGSETRTCSLCGKVETRAITRLSVNPAAISKLKASKKGFTVRWNKVPNVSGYQIQYALKKNYSKGKKTVKVAKADAVSKKIKKLKGKKKYYVRIRSYKTEGGKTYYSAWSKVRSVKTKR